MSKAKQNLAELSNIDCAMLLFATSVISTVFFDDHKRS